MKIKLVEVARSYSQKVNTGNYTSLDVFCSQKLEVKEKDADLASKKAFQFCVKQVKEDIKELTAKPKLDNGVINRVAPTVEEYENMTPEQQKVLKDKQLANNRVKYQENKAIGHIKRVRCPDCEKWTPVGQKCATCHFIGDRYNQKEVNYADHLEEIKNKNYV